MKSRKTRGKDPAKSATGRSGNVQERSATEKTVEEIRLRAYEIYVERGGADGQDLDEWLQAEKQLTDDIRRRRRSN